ncbi:MAG: peptide ABC transporter substrate-binding protein [Thermomicrobiales bacterium]
MNESEQKNSRLLDEIASGSLSRRGVMRKAAALGLSAPVIAGLLAACGGDDDDDDDSSEPTTAPTENAGDQPTETAPESDASATSEDEVASATASEEEPTETAEEAAPTSTEEPAASAGGGGRLDIIAWQAATILNPHLAQGGKDTFAVRIYAEPLAEFDPEGELVPVLAREIPSLENGDVAADGMGVTWRLRENVLWHDGEPFTADDVVFTWEYVTHPDASTSTAGTYATIDSVEAIDDLTVQITFKEPVPDWFNVFTATTGFILPEHLLRDWIGAESQNAPFNLDPIGTGPFRVSEFKPGDTVSYEINENYWDPGKPGFDSVELKGGGDATSAARAVLETGDYDFAPFLQVEPDLLAAMEDAGEGSIGSSRASTVERVVLQFSDPNKEVDGEKSHISTRHPAISELEFRQAMALLVDRDSIATQLYGPSGEATANMLPGPPRFASPNTSYEFNPDKAKEALDAAGWELVDDVRTKNDYETRFVFQTTVNSVRQKSQEIIKQAFEDAGIKVEIKAIESSVYFSGDVGNPDTWTKFYADMGMWSSAGTLYPIQYMGLYKSIDIATDIPQKSNDWVRGNSSRWYGTPASDEYNELWAQAEGELDPDTQEELFIRMNDIIVENVVEIPLVWRFQTYAVKNGLTGVRASGWSNEVWNIQDWTRED